MNIERKIGIAILTSCLLYLLGFILGNLTFYSELLLPLLFLGSGAIVFYIFFKIKVLPIELTDEASEKEKKWLTLVFSILFFLFSFLLSGNVLNVLVLGSNYLILSSEIEKEEFDVISVHKSYFKRSKNYRTAVQFSNGKYTKTKKYHKSEYEKWKKIEKIDVFTKRGLWHFKVIVGIKSQ